jgi:putative FmdB family regulatory protein
MPIYAYRCSQCGFAQDVLQKMSDATLTQCPECHTENFVKQVTAAGFQLKGSGWYQTDFKGGNAPAAKSDAAPPCQGGTASCACNP